jgi:phosphoadenosine phosphosulfate reductase
VKWIVVFEGVRADESEKRALYQKEAKGVKHSNVVNVRPLLEWNSTEVYLYLFYRDLKINLSYRYGLSRVGCSICPMASEWSEYVLSKMNKEVTNSYVNYLKNYIPNLGIKNKTAINRYIAEGQWKKRAGGRAINKKSNVEFLITDNKIRFIIINPREDFLEWLNVLGDIHYNNKNHNLVHGELKVSGITYTFKIYMKKEKEIIEFDNTNINTVFLSKLKKIIYKTTYCIHCGTCETECIRGALKINNKVIIEKGLCTHCGNCFNFTEKACLVAKSIHQNIGGGSANMKSKTSGIDKYSTFGLREEWLQSFLNYRDNWIENNNLGPKQIPAVIHWLVDAELIDSKSKKMTVLGEYISNMRDNVFIWSIVWINMYYNSKIIQWFLDKIGWESIITKKELKERIKLSFPNLSEGTLSNPVDAMINMFDNSPLGESLKIGLLEKKGRVVKFIKKIGTNDIHPLAVAYSLYKAAEHIGRRDFTVTELYSKEFQGGPYKLFGISQDQLARILRGLQEDKEQLLRVELIADLDNIYLRDDLLSLDIIKIAKERKE